MTIERSPETFPSAQLFAHDFDGTVANTFEPAPTGVGVEEAYNQAIETVFDTAALEEYLQSGGLQNRAPSEVVRQLAPDATDSELSALTDNLIAAKLSVLLDQIGSPLPGGGVWPRPIEGFPEFLAQLEDIRKKGAPIDVLALSSGHDAFIRRVYEVWSEPQPDHIIATEQIAELAPQLSLRPDQLIKPQAGLMDAARYIWRSAYNVREPMFDERSRVVYAGDDTAKDGGLAINGGVDFVLIGKENPSANWRTVAHHLSLGRAAYAGVML